MPKPEQTAWVINQVDLWGVAQPPGAYPNPVKVTRKVHASLSALAATGFALMDSIQATIDALRDVLVGDHKEAADFVSAQEKEYLRGLHGDGFEVKRYRAALEFYNHEESVKRGSAYFDITVLREEEVADGVVRFVSDTKNQYAQMGYIVKSEPPPGKGIMVCRNVPNPTTGVVEEVHYANLRITVVLARDRTSPFLEPGSGRQAQRYPAASDIQKWQMEQALIKPGKAAAATTPGGAASPVPGPPAAPPAQGG